jgi:hypothetical protein
MMSSQEAKASTSKEYAGDLVSPSKTIYSSPSSLSTSGFLSDNDLSPPWDQGWQLFIPASIQDGPSRFGFIEVCKTTFLFCMPKFNFIQMGFFRMHWLKGMKTDF